MAKRIITACLAGAVPFLLSASLGIPRENQSLIYNVTLVGILIVLFSLTIVSFSVGIMSKTIDVSEKNRLKKKAAGIEQTEVEDEGSVIAVATALCLEMRAYQEEEKAILTIRKVIKPFSGWNSKALGMRNFGKI
ncbi:MAG: hypothetical protein JXR21_02605 [Candidatus Marinimicrobia bacterium]|nr:hypothetical protein [Candidatus Neomarinimicrobiota bacterium]